MKKTSLIFFLLLSFNLYAQRLLKLTVRSDGAEKAVAFYSKKGFLFVSSKGLANALGTGFYYNSKADKAELKTDAIKIKFTARNQYVVVADARNKIIKIFQMPISTILINNDVFIPLKYSIYLLEKFLNKKIKVDYKEKVLIATSNKGYPSISLKNKGNITVGQYDITQISVSEKSNGTLITLFTKVPIYNYNASIYKGILLVTLGKIKVAPDLLNNLKPTGLITGWQLKNINGSVQLSFKLKKNYESVDSFTDDNGNILIAIHNKIFKNKGDNLNKLLKKWKFDTIVIDPGHGGKDTGAIGLGGVKEKNINLGIALKLGTIIKRNLKKIKVIFTRKTDKFVELYKRGKIANENHGDLFISIHCNSLRHKPDRTNGFEIYLLRPGKTKEAIRIAEYENSVIKFENDPEKYKKLTAENFILVSMARSAFMRYSEKFSDFLNHTYSRFTAIKSRGVKQAGFYVLVGASMPGVLIETGFLSNRHDVGYLSSAKGQYAIAKAIFIAIKKYIQYYSKSINKES